MSGEKKASLPALGLSEEEFDALDPKEQLAYLTRVLFEFDRRYRKWLARERQPGGVPGMLPRPTSH